MSGPSGGLALLAIAVLGGLAFVRGYFGPLVDALTASVSGTATKRPFDVASAFSTARAQLPPGAQGAYGVNR